MAGSETGPRVPRCAIACPALPLMRHRYRVNTVAGRPPVPHSLWPTIQLSAAPSQLMRSPHGAGSPRRPRSLAGRGRADRRATRRTPRSTADLGAQSPSRRPRFLNGVDRSGRPTGSAGAGEPRASAGYTDLALDALNMAIWQRMLPASPPHRQVSGPLLRTTDPEETLTCPRIPPKPGDCDSCHKAAVDISSGYV